MPEYHFDTNLARSTWQTLDAFERAYIETMMWTLIDDDGTSLDYLGLHDIAESTLQSVREDCRAFRETAGNLLDDADPTQAGHDFALTRNHHGVGFWDRDVSTYQRDPKGRELTDIAHGFGEDTWYVGDDGQVWN